MTVKAILTTLSACAVLAFAQAPAPTPQSEEKTANMQEKAQTKELSGKVASFDANTSVLRLQGSEQEIQLTTNTKLAGGITVATIQPGLNVKVTIDVKPDGKWEAREVKPAS